MTVLILRHTSGTHNWRRLLDDGLNNCAAGSVSKQPASTYRMHRCDRNTSGHSTMSFTMVLLSLRRTC